LPEVTDVSRLQFGMHAGGLYHESCSSQGYLRFLKEYFSDKGFANMVPEIALIFGMQNGNGHI
jgi:hypothetical protein